MVAQKNADEMADFMDSYMKVPEFEKTGRNISKRTEAKIRAALLESTPERTENSAIRKLFIENQNTPALSLR